MKYNTEITKTICHLSEPEIDKLLRWHTRQPAEIRIEAQKLASDLYYQYREKYPGEKNEVRYSVFILALKKMKHFDHVLMKKNPDPDLRKIREITEMKADRFLARGKAKQKRNKPAKKKDKLLEYWEEIQILREKRFSFRMIAKFLKTHHHFKIHGAYIEKIWKEKKIGSVQKITKTKTARFADRVNAEEKSGRKKTKLIAHQDEIQMLREKGSSFRMIAEFLKTHRDFAISWAYIAKIWKELEN